MAGGLEVTSIGLGRLWGTEKDGNGLHLYCIAYDDVHQGGRGGRSRGQERLVDDDTEGLYKVELEGGETRNGGFRRWWLRVLFPKRVDRWVRNEERSKASSCHLNGSARKACVVERVSKASLRR